MWDARQGEVEINCFCRQIFCEKTDVNMSGAGLFIENYLKAQT